MRVPRLLTAAAAAVVIVMPAGAQQQRDAHARLFPPQHLGLLEGRDRDEWQQPDRVMDELRISDGAEVADIGAGGGWFTIRLAYRVGPRGLVYAEDIQPEMIDSIQRRVAREGLSNVRTCLGTPADPRLPGGLAAALMVDTYPQIGDPVSVLRNIRDSLAPNGRLGIVDFKLDGAGGPGPELGERISPEVVKSQAAAAGLRLISHQTFLKYQYLLVFERAEDAVGRGFSPGGSTVVSPGDARSATTPPAGSSRPRRPSEDRGRCTAGSPR
jgi:predicted methyltransferase